MREAAAARATWYLVAGPTGAGKTTYSRSLVERVGGVHLSVDEWMNTLFWPDLPEKNDFGWAMERVARCEAQAAVIAVQLAACGVPAVIDFGLTTRAQRGGWLQRAAEAGIGVELHSLELPAEVRWARVEARNASAEGTFVFPVSRAMFEGMEQLWESPDDDEETRYRRLHRIAE